jgi:hypothetical protein
MASATDFLSITIMKEATRKALLVSETALFEAFVKWYILVSP